MTILSFETDLPNDAFGTLALPIEVRTLNMALVRRTLASLSVEVEPGNYYVTAKLPNGRRLFGQSEIQGEHAKIVLSPEFEDEIPLSSFDEAPPRSDNSSDISPVSDRESVLYAHEMGASVPARPQVKLLTFVGNVLTGEFSAHEFDQQEITWAKPFSVKGNSGNTLVQLLQHNFPPLNIVLPIYLGESCEVSLHHSSGERVEVSVHLINPEADLLLQYLDSGYLQQAATLVNAEALSTKTLLANQNFSAAAIKSYTQLRLGDLDELSDLFEQSSFWPDAFVSSTNRFPDASVIRGEVLARLGKHEQAIEAFCELPRLGLPFFGDGLSYAVGRLKLYYQCGAASFETKALSLVSSTLSTLQKFSEHAAGSHSLLSYTGFNIGQPDRIPFAIAAGGQMGMLLREKDHIALLDVMPLSLGIETLGGVFTKLIERNTAIPAHKSEIFSTASDNQTSVEVHVLLGERPMVADNRTLGRFHLVGIPAAPRGMPQIEVAFDIDANGIVNVSAKDVSTGREQRIRITSSSGLGKHEIDRIIRDAESRTAEDLHKREEIESLNRLDGMIYQVEKTLNENRDKLSTMDDEIKSAITDGKRAIEKREVERMNHAFGVLQSLSHKMAEGLYKVQSFMDTEMAATAGSSAGEEDTELNADAQS